METTILNAIPGALADLVLVVHALFVAFVVLSLVVILVGGALGWPFVRDRRFRAAHLLAIGVVVLQAWCGIECPLTTLEMALRERAGDTTYEGSCIAHWVGRLLYHDAPPWVFVTAYSLFAAAVAVAWWRYPPRSSRDSHAALTRD